MEAYRFFFFFLIFVNLKGRGTERKSYIYWFTPQMPAEVGAGLGQSQKPELADGPSAGQSAALEFKLPWEQWGFDLASHLGYSIAGSCFTPWTTAPASHEYVYIVSLHLTLEK